MQDVDDDSRSPAGRGRAHGLRATARATARSRRANGSSSSRGNSGAIAAKSAPQPAITAAAAITPPKRVESETSWTTPETPMKASRNAPSMSRDGHGPDGESEERGARRRSSRPAKKSQRETTSCTLGPLSAAERRRPAARDPPPRRTRSHLRACVRRQRAPATGRCSRRRARPAEGIDEHAPAGDARLPGEHRASPFRIALIPDASRTSSSKTNRTRVGALPSTAPSAGTVRSEAGMRPGGLREGQSADRTTKERARGRPTLQET